MSATSTEYQSASHLHLSCFRATDYSGNKSRVVICGRGWELIYCKGHIGKAEIDCALDKPLLDLMTKVEDRRSDFLLDATPDSKLDTKPALCEGAYSWLLAPSKATSSES